MMSVASVEQLDQDDRKPAIGDYEFSLDTMKVQRIEAAAWIGPKGSLKDLRPINCPAQKVLYEDAGLYDFAYIVGEAIPIKDVPVSEKASLKDTRITSYFSEDIAPNRPIPTRDPEYWSSPSAIGRQLRLCK